MSYGLKIKALRMYLNVNQKDFSEKIGLTRSNLSQIERGKSNPTIIMINEIVNKIHIPASYFFKKFPESSNLQQMAEHLETLMSTDSLSKSIVEERQADYSKTLKIEKNKRKSAGNIRLFDVKATADFLANVDNAVFLELQPSFHLPQFENGQHFAFQVTGNAMNPTILSHDFVICKLVEQPEYALRPGHVYIIADKMDGIVCRRLYYDEDKGVKCTSDNTNFLPYTVQWKSIVRTYYAVGRISLNFNNNNSDISQELQDIKAEIKKIKQKL